MDYNDLFTYDHAAGILIWKTRDRGKFKSHRIFRSWNSRYANKMAGSIMADSNGRPMYCALATKSVKMERLVHRVVWIMHNGNIPNGMVVDHINGNPWDNRLSNLRLCSQKENTRNSRKHSTNNHGVKGVSWDKKNRMWQTEIRTDIGRVFLGRHITKGLAALAYAKASLRYHGRFSPILRSVA